jgi:hypothetical protein
LLHSFLGHAGEVLQLTNRTNSTPPSSSTPNASLTFHLRCPPSLISPAAAPLRCKRPFVDADGNIWLPGDPLEFAAALPGGTDQSASGSAVVLRLLAADIEQGEVLTLP